MADVFFAVNPNLNSRLSDIKWNIAKILVTVFFFNFMIERNFST